MTTPAWYQTAVFYEVPVYGFRDGDGDGVGDFSGLIEKLDYLQWLGIDCVWVLPFFDSPLLDGGYDVADFRAVLERYGSTDDVRRFLDEAHRRGIRVIADLILNHTSDQHSWFQEARDPSSDKHDWYVWSETPDRYAEVRVIFTDTHDSNWTWDEQAGKYYWHRFFWHQPDLNFDNPAVTDAMLDVVRYWLDMGFDGFRLDAVPYLYEREGTSGESLPETHEWLKVLRTMVDDEYTDKVLLAEANQQPVEMAKYFGDGDECHMAFHFPLMPRLFLSLATGDARPVTELLADTPTLPAGAQWAIFLRNHDELTLEMATEEEREVMYAAYAPDPAMRKNVGIRRRLAPLVGGDRRKIELLHHLLFSLPGSPVMYYGDEIGMGDVYTLEDRDGVRTPMQWAPTPGAGFSAADPETFYLPLVSEPAYSTAEVNVASQKDNDASLLQSVRHRVLRRRDHPVMGTGTCIPIASTHRSVLAFLRASDEEEILVVSNMADEEVTVDLEISGYRSPLTLGPYECRWMWADQ